MACLHPQPSPGRIDFRLHAHAACMNTASVRLPRLLLLLVSPFGIGLAEAVENYEGLAYARKGGQLLYRESHWIQEKGQRLVLYRCPDGTAFARKSVASGSVAPDFELVDGRDGYREGVRTRSGMRQVYTKAPAASAERSKRLPAQEGQIIDAGFDAHVRQHWDAMAPSGSQRARFVVPSRLESMDFQLIPLASDSNTRRYRLALDAWYAGALPSITVTYAATDRRLMRFEGIGNIRDAAGDFPAVRIEFPANKRTASSLAEVADAVSTPLAKGCSNS